MNSGNTMIKVLKGRMTARINALLIASIIAGMSTPFINAQTSGTVQSFGEGISAKKFYSSTIDEDNTIWFLTESGIVSFDGAKWTLHNKNRKVAATGLKSVVYGFCLLYTSPSPRDRTRSRMPSSA